MPTSTLASASTPVVDQALLKSKFNEANTHYSQGEFDDAVADCTTVIQLMPDHADAYYNRGTAYVAKGDYARVIADWAKAIDLKPDLVLAYSNRGIAYQQKGQLDKAIADFRKVLELSQDPQVRAFTEKQLQALGAK